MTARTLPYAITFVLPDLGGGGAQRVILTLAGKLDPGLFAVRLLVGGGAPTLAGALPESVSVTLGGHKRLRSALPWMIAHLRAQPPDVCVSVMGYLNLALLAARPALQAGIALAVREANTVDATLNAMPKWLRGIVPGSALYRLLYNRADAVIAPSPAIRDELIALLSGVQAPPLFIPNPVDVASLRAAAARPHREPGSGLRLVSVGRLTRQKGYDRFFPVFAGLGDDSHFTILGEGDDRPSLEAQIRDLGLENRVSLPGFSHEAARWMAGADALVLPSRWEGLPNSALEALAVGTPVVASEEASLGVVMASSPEGAVIICPDQPTFADALAQLPASSVLPSRERLRPCLLPAAFEIDAVVSRWEELLVDLCRSGANV